jgi:hypothetical protein
MRLDEAKRELKAERVTITKKDGEYRVNLAGGAEAAAYYTNDITDAVETGHCMGRRARKVEDHNCGVCHEEIARGYAGLCADCGDLFHAERDCAGDGNLCSACRTKRSNIEIESFLESLANCAGCGAVEYTYIGQLGRVTHVRCRACGLPGSVEVR